ncbi:MAG: AMP-binding protein [Nostoc sp. LLA-1]|nr:AMP-binding protein [Cyanocohniella sp. LLY]
MFVSTKGLNSILENPSNIVSILRYRGQNQPNRQSHIYLEDRGIEPSVLTYQALDIRAQAIASELQFYGFCGERALLLYPPGLEYISAFFGCLYAGVVAVPAYPPRLNRSMFRLQSIIADVQPAVILTIKSHLEKVKHLLAGSLQLNVHWVATDDLPNSLAAAWHEPVIDSDTLAFIQYTSGSTGSPKGVMISHQNILYNEKMLQLAFEHTEQSIGVGWLPLFHDMGLIGNIFQPLYVGFPCTLMSPVDVLQNPFKWLQAISRYKGTTSGGPNFIYDLCIRKITPEQRMKLNLGSWDVAFTGAEPIRSETIEKFAEVFKPCGFRREAFYPCYGMAETTLIVSGGYKKNQPVLQKVQKEALTQTRVLSANQDCGDEQIQAFIGCGKPLLDEEVLIVNPKTATRCLSNEIGEIWVAGSNVAQGYWNNTEATKQIFQAYLADTGAGPFLRTGDLGFLYDGELFITGRMKDLIIIRGRNHYPQDIELTVEQSHPALRPGCGAAFSVDIAVEEQLVVIQEIERAYLKKLDVDEIFNAICRAVAQQHEIQVHAILLIKTGSIPKTSSGKIQRYACRTDFLSAKLDIVAEWKLSSKKSNLQSQFLKSNLYEHLCSLTQKVMIPNEDKFALDIQSFGVELIQNTIITWLKTHLAMHLNISPDEINMHVPLADYGLDSSISVSITAELSEWLSCELSPTLFWEAPTLEILAQYLTDNIVSSHK